MTIKVGDRMPAGKFKMMGPEGPKDVSSDEIFKGKKVVLFAVPGAFTPTCSARHLPGFVTNAAAFKAKGIGTIACMAVNDVFVMDAWGKDQKVGDKVMMLADGSGDYTKALGLELDLTGGGLGKRSRRFAIVVNDGKVESLALEEGGALKISDAESVLKQV
jgi:peroxiredoxin (alkyl hydroperoxide reductase subunit C)